MSAIDRSYDMTSFSVRDILNLPDTGLCPSKSETTHESSSTESYHCPGGNTHTPSCGSVVCNQGQEYSYTSKNELDFVSLIERKVNAGIYEVLNSIDGKNLAEVLERVYFIPSVNYARRDGFFAYNRIFRKTYNDAFYEAIASTIERWLQFQILIEWMPYCF